MKTVTLAILMLALLVPYISACKLKNYMAYSAFALCMHAYIINECVHDTFVVSYVNFLHFLVI